MRKLLQNKKGLSEFVLDIFSYLVFIIAIFFFLLLFKLQSINATERDITEIREAPSSSTTILNYLRTPVNVDGNEINMAELIRLWHLEPDKYINVLEASSVEILDRMEYEYKNPNANNIVVRGFNVIINSEKRDDNSLDFLVDFESQSFESGYVIRDAYGRGIIQAEQFVPISENQYLYVVLMESQKAK